MKTIIPIAILSAFLGAAPAVAGEPVSNARSQSISYADLDLTSQAGLAELDRRIGLAVRNACGTASDVDPQGKNEVRHCRSLTKAQVAGARSSVIASASRQKPGTTAAGR